MTNQCEHRQLGRTCLLCEMRDENLALRAKLADCQDVIRDRGHDADCPTVACSVCGRLQHIGLEMHRFITGGPCSDACGYSRCVGVE